MRKKQYLVLVIILAVIVAALFAVRAAKSRKEKAEEEQTAAETVYAVRFDASEVTAFSYQYEGNTLEFVKEDESWSCKTDETVTIDGDSIETMLNAISSITADSTVEDVSDLSEYGLDEPTQEVVLAFADGSAKTMTFGMENQVISGYYLQVSGDSNVYLVNSSYVTSVLSKSLEDLTAEEEESDTADEDTSDTEEETSDTEDEENSDTVNEETSDTADEVSETGE